ncbi:MAG: GNAT family N-acetyltransferase [Chitinophagaceae bacterium]|nr:GNAT family N-acetyltransferase [Chitinophagaceae bacterium]
MLTLKRTNSSDKDFHKLIGQLDTYLFVHYGQLQSFYGQYNKVDNIPTAVIAYIEKEPAGCGCFKQFDESAVEIKRMFVVNEHRGKGIGAAILTELENWAAELGQEATVLELGNNQPEAIRLYQKAGFRVIPNYGQYVGMETSICMKKELQ